MPDLEPILKTLGQYQSLFVLLGFFVAGVWKAAVETKKRVVLPIKTHMTQVQALSAEFKPNGGSSIKDQLNRIEALTKISLRLTDKAYWISDASGQCMEASPALAALMGLTPEQIQGHGWVNAISASCRREVEEAWESAVREQREFHLDYEYTTPQGLIVPITAHSIPIRSGGKVTGYVGWAWVRVPTIPSNK